MALQDTIQAFKAHIHSFAGEPVSLEWPADEKRAIHVFVYSVFPNYSRYNEVRPSLDDDQFVVIRALVFANPEYEYGSLDRVMRGLRQHPIFDVEDSRARVHQLPLATDEVAQIFLARQERYRLAVAYEIQVT